MPSLQPLPEKTFSPPPSSPRRVDQFFALTSDGKGSFALKGSAGQFGSQQGQTKPAEKAAATQVHTVTAAAFLSATSVVTGNADGEICSWKKMKSGMWALKARVKAHKTGSKERCDDGSLGFSGVRVLRLRGDGQTLLSGGADGLVMLWAVTSGAITRALPPPSFFLLYYTWNPKGNSRHGASRDVRNRRSRA